MLLLLDMWFLVFVTAAVVFFVIGYCLFGAFGAFVTACRSESWGKRVIAIIGLLSMIGYIVLAFR